MKPPLLTICLPLYKGAGYLTNVLELLCQQIQEAEGRVELILVDDASQDGAEQIAAPYSQDGLLRYIGNPTNLGLARNQVRCTAEHAKGEYVWVWSQHCLLHPGALAQVLNFISDNADIDAFYVNFRCALFPEDWPDAVQGQYDGPYRYVCRDDFDTRRIRRWEELLTASTAVCTQSYAHILRRSLSVAYWRGREVGPDFSRARDTYPLTCAVAETMFGKPCGYIGTPVFTIFNGAQTWSHLPVRSRVYLQGHPDLLRIYQQHGWAESEVRAAKQWAGRKAAGVIVELAATGRWEDWRRIGLFLCKHGFFLGVGSHLWAEFFRSDFRVARVFRKISGRCAAILRYCFVYCRPARWVRSQTKRRRDQCLRENR